MGGLINGLFGGGSDKQAKKSIDFQKQVYDENKALATPWAEKGLDLYGTAFNFLNGTGEEGYNSWLNSSDYKFITAEGTKAIENSMAAKGMLNSGATLKGLTSFGQDTAQQYRQNYLTNLLGGATVGQSTLNGLMGSNQNAADAIANIRANKAQQKAGGVSNMLNTGLGIAALISDPRLKTDVVKVGELPDGLGIYDFRYIWSKFKWRGVMADEVARLRPWALGPQIDGFFTVNYGKLSNV